MEEVTGMGWVGILTTIVTTLNGLFILYSSWKKNKPEVKKLELEGDSELVEAANANLEGARISGEMLLTRITELKADLDREREARKADVEYFKRRLKEAQQEARDYRAWAALLVKQVVEAGKIPAPFAPAPSESEVGIPTIKEEDIRQQIQKEKE